MYHPHVTARVVEETSRAQGWDLVYSSPTKIASAIAHFEELLDDETGRLKRPLTPEERAFIQNERKLCALDFLYWASNYAKIVDWSKKTVPFIPNIAQAIIIDIWAEHEERGLAIMLQQLKARQLGVTTLNQMAVTHRFQFWPFTNAIVASADPKKTVEMGQMIKFCLDSQPWWMLPVSADHNVDKQEKGMIVEFGDLNTRLSIQAGNQFHGVARGATPNVGQLSEVSSWDNAEDDIDASFIRAIHETPDVFVSLESTALGRDNWWARSWELVKEEWPRGRSRLRGIFLPWFVGTDIYPTATDLRTRPVPANWIPMDRTIHHAERARAYVKSNPALFQYLAKGNADWRMPRTQMWYYEIEREMAIRKKTLNKFLAEMTSDDQECVIGSTRISTPHGIIPIAEASKSTSTETGRVTKWWDRGLRDVMAVTTKFGREVAGTPDHRLALVDGSWRSIAALRVGDRLKLSPPIFSESKYVARWKWSPTCEMALPIDKDLAKLIGVFVGDGCWGSNSIEIACFIQDTDTIAEIERIITAIIGRPPTHSTRGGLYLIRSSSIKWWQLWWNLGLLDRRYHKRQDRHSGYIKRLRVPECIWRSPKPVVAAFLSGLFETDGHASRFAPQTSFFTKSPDLMRDVQLLLLGFGINAEHRHSEKRKGPYVFTGRVLRLNALNTVRFHEQIGFMGQRKRSAVKTVKTGRGRRPNPIVMEDTVQSVEARDRQPVYDISIAETHAFGGNGILCHNSFQNTGLSVIDQDVILSYREKVRPPLGVYAIIGPGIHPSLVPPRHLWLTGPNDPAVITVHASKACRSTEIFQFVPLKFEGYPGYDPMGKLFIYEWPADGETYGTGCDTADGIGQDWSVIEGFRKGNATACHAQTCEYASPYIKADQLWPMMLAISCFYSTTHRADGRPMQCRAAIECRGNGEIVQSEMQKRGWWNFHPWKKYDNKRPIPDANVHKLGVFTNVWFRSMMLDKLLTCIDEEALEVGSPWFVNEMASLERDPDENSARAAYDTHDDRVMALGFALFSLTVEDRPSKTFRRSTPQYLPESTDADPVLVGAYPTWSPGLQANSELGNRLAYPVDRSRVGMPTLGTPRRPTGKGW